MEGSLAGFEEEVGGGIDDDTVDFPLARAALNGQIGVFPRIIYSDISKQMPNRTLFRTDRAKKTAMCSKFCAIVMASEISPMV